MNQLLQSHLNNRKLNQLVENRTIYNASYAELSIFETYEVAKQVKLLFDYPVIASMLTGKKVMHLEGLPTFDFFPGESIVVPSKKELIIDFPDATKAEPTQCLALAIDPSKINDITSRFNELVAIENENNQWSLDIQSSHLTNQTEVNYLIHRLVYTFTNNTKPKKDLILDLMIQELIVRLLQTKAKQVLLSEINGLVSDSRIGYVIKYIKEHLTEKNINVDKLTDLACMSTSHFYKQFKNTIGVSPIDFINSERIKMAKKLFVTDKDFRITDIAYKSGFSSVSYFNRQFKKIELITPSAYLKAVKSQL
jgi:AraC-like DNA-binding protein